MNIIGISVLEELKKYPVFQHAIIAGGMCRDHILGNKFKDVDIFVPITKGDRSLFDGLNNIEGIKLGSDGFSFGNFKFNYKFDANKYTSDVNYKGKFDGLYSDTVPIQRMTYRYNKIENFPLEVVSGFNFWIDQIYWDGKELVVTPEANKDIKNHRATLCRLNGWDEMPGAMNKFLRLKEKYPDLKLDSVYEIVDPRQKNKKAPKEESQIKYYSSNTISNTNQVWQIFDDQAVQQAR